MASRNPWRDAPLSGDNLYGDRENLRRYRDAARDEHRRFARDYEREQQGGLPFTDTLTEYDRSDEDFTGGNFRPNRRHATEGGYAYGNYGGVTPEGRRYEGANHFFEIPRRGNRGPTNVQRQDRRIYEDVCERLKEDDRIDASDIEVNVAGGEVTLSGKVRSRNSKRRATFVIEDVLGVKDVHNSIRVVDDQTSSVTNYRTT
jgi:hyperosmotically inducible protein